MSFLGILGWLLFLNCAFKNIYKKLRMRALENAIQKALNQKEN